MACAEAMAMKPSYDKAKVVCFPQVTWDDFRLVPQSAFSPWQIHPVLGAPLPTANGSSPFSASNAQGRERTPDQPAQIPVSLQTESPCNSESAVTSASGGEATFTADRALSTEGPKAGSRQRRETGAKSTVGCHKRKRHAAGEGVAARRFVKTRRPRAISQPEMLPSNLGRSLESALGAIWASSGGKDGGFGSTFLGGTLEAGSFSTSCMSEAAKPAGLGHKPIGLDTVSGTEPASPGPETGGLRPEAGGLSPETGGLRASSAGVGTSALCSDAEPAGFGSSFEFSFKDGFGGQGPEDDTASTASSDDVRKAADDEVSKPCHSSGAKSEHAGSHQASQGLFPLKREAANRESIRGVSASLSEPPSSVAETAPRNFWEEAKRWRRQVGSVAEMCGESNPPRGFCGEASEPSSSRLGVSPHLVGCQPEAGRKGVLNGLYWAFPSWQGWVTSEGENGLSSEKVTRGMHLSSSGGGVHASGSQVMAFGQSSALGGDLRSGEARSYGWLNPPFITKTPTEKRQMQQQFVQHTGPVVENHAWLV